MAISRSTWTNTVGPGDKTRTSIEPMGDYFFNLLGLGAYLKLGGREGGGLSSLQKFQLSLQKKCHSLSLFSKKLKHVKINSYSSSV